MVKNSIISMYFRNKGTILKNRKVSTIDMTECMTNGFPNYFLLSKVSVREWKSRLVITRFASSDTWIRLQVAHEMISVAK